MKKRKVATERLHKDYKKMFKYKEFPTIVMDMFNTAKLNSISNKSPNFM